MPPNQRLHPTWLIGASFVVLTRFGISWPAKVLPRRLAQILPHLRPQIPTHQPLPDPLPRLPPLTHQPPPGSCTRWGLFYAPTKGKGRVVTEPCRPGERLSPLFALIAPVCYNARSLAAFAELEAVAKTAAAAW